MKRKPISSDADVKAAKLGDTPGAGAPGLFLHTHAAKDGLLTRSWFVRLPGSGKRLKRGLGAYPVVTLAEARRKASTPIAPSLQGLIPASAPNAVSKPLRQSGR